MAGKSKAESMLPEDSADTAYDMTELRVDFSDKELSSEAKDFSPVPSGKYPCTIVEWEIRKSTSEKNYGKPYWALRLRVNDDNKYAGRLFFPNVMLFSGALYTYVQLAKALGGEFEASVEEGNPNYGKIPHGDNLIGKEVVAIVARKVDKYKIDQGEWTADSGEPKPLKNDVTGFLPINAGSVSSSSGGNSLMP